MIFSTFPGKRHEYGALLAAICAQSAGRQVRSLGPDLPVAEFATTATQCGADVVAISIVSLPQPQIDEHLH